MFNGYGARVGSGDSLTSTATTLAPVFTWISHTWDHRVLTGMSYASAFDELSLNNQFAIGAGLAPYRIDNLVTPEISGLTNVEAMRAAWDIGVRQLAADTAKPEGRSKTPNSGIRNVAVPDLLEIPRRPTEVYYNVSQPAEWIAEYTVMYPGAYTYEQLVATQSEQLLRYLLRGENCPWMFHQANVRDNGGGHSLLRDVLDAAFDRYLARASFPIVSPTMEDLAERVRGRMRYDAAGASATLGPGAQVVVRVNNAAAVPVTGLCTPAAESYGGQKNLVPRARRRGERHAVARGLQPVVRGGPWRYRRWRHGRGRHGHGRRERWRGGRRGRPRGDGHERWWRGGHERRQHGGHERWWDGGHERWQRGGGERQWVGGCERQRRGGCAWWWFVGRRQRGGRRRGLCRLRCRGQRRGRQGQRRRLGGNARRRRWRLRRLGHPHGHGRALGGRSQRRRRVRLLGGGQRRRWPIAVVGRAEPDGHRAAHLVDPAPASLTTSETRPRPRDRPRRRRRPRNWGQAHEDGDEDGDEDDHEDEDGFVRHVRDGCAGDCTPPAGGSRRGAVAWRLPPRAR